MDRRRLLSLQETRRPPGAGAASQCMRPRRQSMTAAPKPGGKIDTKQKMNFLQQTIKAKSAEVSKLLSKLKEFKSLGHQLSTTREQLKDAMKKLRDCREEYRTLQANDRDLLNEQNEQIEDLKEKLDDMDNENIALRQIEGDALDALESMRMEKEACEQALRGSGRGRPGTMPGPAPAPEKVVFRKGRVGDLQRRLQERQDEADEPEGVTYRTGRVGDLQRRLQERQDDEDEHEEFTYRKGRVGDLQRRLRGAQLSADLSSEDFPRSVSEESSMITADLGDDMYLSDDGSDSIFERSPSDHSALMDATFDVHPGHYDRHSKTFQEADELERRLAAVMNRSLNRRRRSSTDSPVKGLYRSINTDPEYLAQDDMHSRSFQESEQLNKRLAAMMRQSSTPRRSISSPPKGLYRSIITDPEYLAQDDALSKSFQEAEDVNRRLSVILGKRPPQKPRSPVRSPGSRKLKSPTRGAGTCPLRSNRRSPLTSTVKPGARGAARALNQSPVMSPVRPSARSMGRRPASVPGQRATSVPPRRPATGHSRRLNATVVQEGATVDDILSKTFREADALERRLKEMQGKSIPQEKPKSPVKTPVKLSLTKVPRRPARPATTSTSTPYEDPSDRVPAYMTRKPVAIPLPGKDASEGVPSYVDTSQAAVPSYIKGLTEKYRAMLRKKSDSSCPVEEKSEGAHRRKSEKDDKGGM
ncbi:cytospin-A-like isoform X2 [Ambystoma mexicanum]|uniref:cytospin-A-like isoform X2 n=1 Tax=Ambystoma mexicanum TaxID=8296 RepID=UPI0037E7BFD2